MVTINDGSGRSGITRKDVREAMEAAAKMSGMAVISIDIDKLVMSVVLMLVEMEKVGGTKELVDGHPEVVSMCISSATTLYGCMLVELGVPTEDAQIQAGKFANMVLAMYLSSREPKGGQDDTQDE